MKSGYSQRHCYISINVWVLIASRGPDGVFVMKHVVLCDFRVFWHRIGNDLDKQGTLPWITFTWPGLVLLRHFRLIVASLSSLCLNES